MQMGQKDGEYKGGNRGEKHALGWEEVQELAPGELKTTWRRAVGEIKHAQRQQVAPWVARSESRRITADLMDMLRSEEEQGNMIITYIPVYLCVCVRFLCVSPFRNCDCYCNYYTRYYNYFPRFFSHLFLRLTSWK